MLLLAGKRMKVKKREACHAKKEALERERERERRRERERDLERHSVCVLTHE